MVALITVWDQWPVIPLLAGLRNIPAEIYEAAELRAPTLAGLPEHHPATDLAGHRLLTIQLILQMKIFDQVYLFSMGGRTQATMVLVRTSSTSFAQNKGGYGALRRCSSSSSPFGAAALGAPRTRSAMSGVVAEKLCASRRIRDIGAILRGGQRHLRR
jgi:hypothetical protein